MSDLLNKFFEEDLSDREWEALGKQLEESPQLAERFSEVAVAAYGGYGLPAPVWNSHNSDSKPRPKSKFPWKWIAAVFGVSGTLAALLALGSADSRRAPAWQLRPEKRDQKGFDLRQTSAQAPAKASVAKKKAPISTAKAVYRPVKVDRNVPVEKEALTVEIDLKSSQLVTAQILGPQGESVYHLFSGVLKPGLWSFGWDGQLGDGSMVRGGKYTIEVKAQGKRFTRRLNIR